MLAHANTKLQAKILDVKGRSRRSNIGLPESVEGTCSTEFIAGLLVEVLGDQVLTSPPELDRALTAKPGQGEKPQSVVICFHKFQTRDLAVCESRKIRGKLRYRAIPIHIFEDYSPDVLNQRSEYRDVMKELYKPGLKPALHYAAKLFVTPKNEGKKQLFSVKEAHNLASTHCNLQSRE